MLRYNKHTMLAVYYSGLLSLLLLDWTGLAMALAMAYLFQTVGISVTYHRYYAHKSFEFKYEWMRKACSLIGLVSGQSSPALWAAVHSAHHKHADTEKDPHSPTHGLVRAFLWMEWAPHDIRTVARLMKDPFNKFLYEYTTIIILVYWLVLFAVGGVWLVISMGLAPAALSILGSNSVNYFSHRFGYRTYETKSEDRNNWLMALLTGGEGWHNNHHAKPTSYTFQHNWWEIDVGAWVIKLIRRRDEDSHVRTRGTG